MAKKKVTEDTVVYLGDIRGTADLIKEEIELIEDKLENGAKVSDPDAFEKLIDDIANEIHKQYLRLQDEVQGLVRGKS
jgi:hypothetical protein